MNPRRVLAIAVAGALLAGPALAAPKGQDAAPPAAKAAEERAAPIAVPPAVPDFGAGAKPASPADPAKAPAPERAVPRATKAGAAYPRTGAELLDSALACERSGVEPSRPAEYRACYGFQAGLVLGPLVLAEIVGLDKPYCVGEADDREIHDAVLQLLYDHPDATHWSAEAVVVAAMIRAFPCARPAKEAR